MGLYPFRLGVAELRSGLQGFHVFLACLVIGVGAIAGVGSLSDRLNEGLKREGQPLLGADIEFSQSYRALAANEQRFFDELGKTSQVITMRAMALAREQSVLVELKAVDAVYPLYGALALIDGSDANAVLARGEALVEPLLLSRLGIQLGDSVRVGGTDLRVGGVIAREPDKISSGFALGPRLMMSREALDRAQLLQPGSLAVLRLRVKLADPTAVAQVEKRAKLELVDAGWGTRSRENVAPQLTRGLEQLTLFLTLAGLTALITGGIGIANAVKAFLDAKRRSIAILKSLGATTRQVLVVYLTEVVAVACVGILAGLVLGAGVPWVVRELAGEFIPVPIAAGLAWNALLLAAVFGMVAVLAFSLWPLGRAVRGEPAVLLRGGESLRLGLPRWPVLLGMVLSFLLLAGLAYVRFDQRAATLYYLGGLVGAFVLFAMLGWLVAVVSRRMPRPQHAVLQLAIANLHRPGAATPAMMLALGLGLTLFVALALVQSGLSRQLRTALPIAAPSFYFVDVADAIAPEMSAMLLETSGVTHLVKAPMLRGRIVRLNGNSPDSIKPTGDGVWALRGDRGITYSDVLPENSKLVAGEWWPVDHQGAPLVSLTRDVAEGLGLKIGDTITVNVLGREITAGIANLRDVEWRSLGINFVMVFTPNALVGAPKSWLMTADVPPAQEADLMKRLTKSFPNVTAVRVRDALDAADKIASAFLSGLSAGSLVTLATGTLVLMGALSGSLAARRHDAVVLKTCGATRRELVVSFAVEYALVGLLAASVSVVAGSAAAWLLLTRIFEVPFVFDPLAAAATAFMALALSTLAGLAATWKALSQPPAQILRNP
jgi:putative ABC transport system permease protein